MPRRPETAREVIELWRTKPGMGPAVRLVEIVIESPLGRIGAPELASDAGLTFGAGTFGAYLSRACTAGLLERDGGEVALGEAFEGMV